LQAVIKGLAPETTLTSFNRFCVKFLMLPEPLLVLVQFRPCCDGCCFCLLDSRSGDGQFLISQVDQIHKMDCISEVTSIGVFRQRMPPPGSDVT
jgi:hypothetical protein